jgi:hypothetical protein
VFQKFIGQEVFPVETVPRKLGRDLLSLVLFGFSLGITDLGK